MNRLRRFFHPSQWLYVLAELALLGVAILIALALSNCSEYLPDRKPKRGIVQELNAQTLQSSHESSQPGTERKSPGGSRGTQ